MTQAQWVLGATVWAALFAAGWHHMGSLLEWPHRRRWIWPLHYALHERLGYTLDTRPKRYLHVPRDFQDGAEVIVRLPTSFAGDDRAKETILAIVRTKLGLSDLDVRWQLYGPKPYLSLQASTRAHQPAR